MSAKNTQWDLAPHHEYQACSVIGIHQNIKDTAWLSTILNTNAQCTATSTSLSLTYYTPTTHIKHNIKEAFKSTEI